MEVNLFGVWRTIRATLPHVVERRGYVLPVASLAAIAWSAGMGPYNASKAGTEALGRTLRAEVAHLGVGVGVAYFSWIDTDLVRGADAHPVGGAVRARLRGPLAKTYPVALTGEAIADGIERRRRSVVVPGWIRPLLAARGVFQPRPRAGLLAGPGVVVVLHSDPPTPPRRRRRPEAARRARGPAARP